MQIKQSKCRSSRSYKGDDYHAYQVIFIVMNGKSQYRSGLNRDHKPIMTNTWVELRLNEL